MSVEACLYVGMSAQGQRRAAFFVGLSDNVGPIKEPAQTPVISTARHLTSYRSLIVSDIVWLKSNTGHFRPRRHQCWQRVRPIDRSFHSTSERHLPVQRRSLCPRTTQGRNYHYFYSAAALLAMQSAVIPTAIPSVCLSVRLSHASIVLRRMKIGSRGLTVR